MNASARPALYRNFHRLAWFALIMTASTIMFGSFVRLSDAGLSCPDWPTCYGRVTWPQTQMEAAQHVASEIRPLETHKAWREQVHRFLAGLLGVGDDCALFPVPPGEQPAAVLGPVVPTALLRLLRVRHASPLNPPRQSHHCPSRGEQTAPGGWGHSGGWGRLPSSGGRLSFAGPPLL